MSPATPSRLSVSRALRLARPQALTLVVGFVALAASSGITLTYPRVIGAILDQADANTAALSTSVLAGLMGLFLVQAAFTLLRAWLFAVAGEHIVADLRTAVYEAVLRQDLHSFDDGRTGEWINRLTSDTAVLQHTLTLHASTALRFGIGAIGGVIATFWLSPQLALLTLAVVPLIAVAGALSGRSLRNLSFAVQDEMARSTGIAEETFGGVRTVRSFVAEPLEVQRYRDAVMKTFDLAKRRALSAGALQASVVLFSYSAVALVLWWGLGLVGENKLTTGDLMSFLLYTMLVAVSFGNLATVYGEFMKSVGASQRLFELLDQASVIETPQGRALPDPTGEIRFTDVSFAYPSRPEAWVLRDFSVHIPANTTVALVGPSGSGKSTVASLLCRFYDPVRGSIAFDDHPLPTLSPRALRSHIGLVSQEPTLFATTIEANIRYGDPEATPEHVRSAARAANAHDFIELLPQGYATEVGERGVLLSGGQKQRIAIARALLKNPRVLILDEATSALDSESEHLVRQALDTLMQGRTTLIIAHRLSTVREADQILVLEEGKIAERGTHESLLQNGNIYSRLHRLLDTSEVHARDLGDTKLKQS